MSDHGQGIVLTEPQSIHKRLYGVWFNNMLWVEGLTTNVENVAENVAEVRSYIKHFAPYIIQRCPPTKVLTDSKACVEAYQKLQRGQFSAIQNII